MKSINKKYIIGFIVLSLIGVALIIAGVVYYLAPERTDLVETQGYVVSVETRESEHGTEYRPFLLRYYVKEQDRYYDTSVFGWFKQTIRQGDMMTMWYKKDDPTYTVVSNTDKETMSLALMGIGGVLIVASIILTAKYVYDVKHGKQ